MSDRPVKIRRFSTTPHQDLTITSKVRTVLYEGGHYDLVTEQLVDALRDIETLARVELKKLQDRVAGLEAERSRYLHESGVIRVLEARAGRTLHDWLKWGVRRVLPWALAALAGGFAWKGWSK